MPLYGKQGNKTAKGEYIYLNIRYKTKHEKEKQKKCTKNIRETFVSFKKVPTFASAIEKQTQIQERKTAEMQKGWPVRLSVRTQDFHS